jgi:hypothetical protein
MLLEQIDLPVTPTYIEELVVSGITEIFLVLSAALSQPRAF